MVSTNNLDESGDMHSCGNDVDAEDADDDFVSMLTMMTMIINLVKVTMVRTKLKNV